MTRNLGYMFVGLPMLAALSAASPPAEAARYYAAPSGSGSTCSQAQPCALPALNGKLRAGDTGVLIAGVYRDVQIKPANSGAPDRPLTYRTQGGTARFRRSAYTAQGAIVLRNVSYVIVQGDIDIDGEGQYVDSKWRFGIQVLRAHHIRVEDVKVKNVRYIGLEIGDGDNDADTRWVDIKGVTIDGAGAYNTFPWTGQYDDSGYAAYINRRVEHVRIRDSHIRRGGHDLITIKGSKKIILRNNDWSNFWEVANYTRTTGYGDIQPGDKVGNRSLVIRDTDDVLVEGNYFHDLYQPTDQLNTSGHKPGGTNTMIRNNYWLRIHNAVGGTGGSNTRPIGVKWYHNSVYDAGGAAVDYTNDDPKNPLRDIHFKNNIFHNIAQNIEPGNPSTNHVVRFKRSREVQGPQWGVNNVWAGNCFKEPLNKY